MHTHSLFPSILQSCCLLRALLYSVLFYQCFCIPADAVPIAESQPPHHHLGGVSFPVYHRSFARSILDPSLASNPFSATPRLSQAPPPPSSGRVPKLRSELVTLAEPFGQYFAELQIGTPAKDIALIIDTGSELMWIQCMPCVQCGLQAKEFPIFNPAKSSSYQNLMCTADMCQGDDSVSTACTVSEACNYMVSYGDKSNSSGILAQETLTFTKADGSSAASKGSSSFTLTQTVFGCGIDNMGVEARFNASGLVGLDRGMYSIISQLGVDVFSYCLPNRANNVDVSGYLTFGGGASSPSNPSLQYTPMIQNNFSTFLSQFYYLNLSGVSVNGKLLDIPAMAFEIDAETGLGGTIIDSGTTLTAFVDEAYTVITQAFENYMGASYKKLDLEHNSTMLCYEVPLSKQRGAPAAPKVTLHFAGSVDMELGTDQLFHLYASDTTNNYYCLAIASGGALASGAKNFIGNYQQQDFLVEYDLANSRVGFAATQCSTTNNIASSLLAFTIKPMWYFMMTFTCILLLL